MRPGQEARAAVPAARAGRSALGLLLAVLVAACSSPEGSGSTAQEAAGRDRDPVQEAAELRALLDDFLANTEVATVHDRFWSDDLVYTSSNGTRQGKSEIMAGFEPSEDAPDDAEQAGPSYFAEDVDIRVYGNTAVVAFRLVIVPPADSGEAQSFNWNTGTFVHRDGEWRAVAWQSTRGSNRP